MTSPMLVKLIDEPFDDKGWIFEIKWDGIRALGFKKGKTAKLISRNQKSLNHRFPPLVTALKKLPGTFVIDGEIVILDKSGRSHFQMLQNYQRTKKGTPLYYVFDILTLNGKDLRKKSVLERKALLKKLISKAKHIRYSNHVRGKGKDFFRKASKKGWEGIIGKRINSSYQCHRSSDWVKIKSKMGQEVVIGGFTKPKGSRKHLGALLIGVYEKGKLCYAGSVGGGFNQELLRTVSAKLKKYITDKCPFSTKPKVEATWVRPRLVCEVAFAEWTNDGKLRQPVFKGLRSDKSPKQVVREKP